jgi:signal transduction histidine kinase
VYAFVVRVSTDVAVRASTIALVRHRGENCVVDASDRGLRISAVPFALFVVVVLAELAAVLLSWGLEPWTDTAIYAVYSIVLAGAGALVASKYGRNPIGWLMLWLGLSNALITDLSQGYGLRAHEQGWRAGTVAEWSSSASVVLQIVPLLLLWLLFPTGRLLSRRWLTVVAAGGVASVLVVGGYSFSHRADAEFVDGSNPYVVDWLSSGAIWVIGNACLVVALVGAAAAPVVRYHRSARLERQQLKVFAIAAALAVVVLPLGPLLWERYPVARAVVAVALLAQPVAVCVAMMRYRLYDIDRVISRTITYGLVTAALIGIYITTVVALGALIGRSSTLVTAGATLAAATAFHPVRKQAQSVVDRRFDRARFDALRRTDRFIEDLHAGRAAPEQVQAVLRDVTGDPELTIHYRADDDAGDLVAGIPVMRGDALVATVTGSSIQNERPSLAAEVIDAAGLAIEIAGLRVELRRRLDEVEASRARLVTVADDERRRLERDLHDGAQQRLVSIGLALRHAQHQLGAGDHPEASRTLDSAVVEIAGAIEELRELAHGLRPSSLDAGLGSALRELARRAPLPVSIATTGERFAPDAETTAYFVAIEALTNAVKHAHASRVALCADQRDGALILRVADDGIGGATPHGGSGLSGMADRLAAVGGTLTVDSGHTGTTVIASIPCAS